MERAGGLLTDTFLTVSQEEAADARRLGIARNPIAVGNGRNATLFAPDPAARGRIRRELGVPPDRVVVTAVSRLVRHKGYPELLAAMATVPADLWVAGERLQSDRGEDMTPYFQNAGLANRLRLLGYRSDVAAILAASDIFVLPSHFEGLPMSVIEAMLCALPVVATNIKGAREQVVAEQTGLLVPPATVVPLAEALTRLATDAALRTRFGTAGRKRALDRFEEHAVIAATLKALDL
jgi:glycosyltransferase involved in cell wall biosynthesis